ncbi:AAA domain-containing protein [Aspergillus californicus]
MTPPRLVELDGRPIRIMHPISLYIVGAQCTGKTTLVHALQGAFVRKYPSLHLRPITEVARKVLQKHQFSRDDITDNPERAFELQQLILAAQCKEESNNAADPVLCDRSGVDPIVYAAKYGPPQAQEILERSPQWQYLRDRMRQSLVIVCPPHQEWLVDDGIRLMAKTQAEWEDVHLMVLQVLQENGIAFHIVPQQLLDVEERVEFVWRLWSNFG